MKKINLTQAKQILKEQGYLLEPTYNELLLEKFDILEDIIFRANDRSFENVKSDEIVKLSIKNENLAKSSFCKKYPNFEDVYSDVYWDIIDEVIKELIKEGVR